MMPQENQSVSLQETSAVTSVYQLHRGEYTIQSVLAQGRWSTVYFASHMTLSLPLAIKRYHTSLPIPETVRTELDRLLRCEVESVPATAIFTLPLMMSSEQGSCFEELVREALFLARVRHPALPMLYDYFFEDDSWYLVMDYIPGKTLCAYLDEKGALLPLEALDYALQLCSVLEYLHAQTPAIVFSALQPENVLLLPDRTVALIDFGHAHYEKERISVARASQSMRNAETASQMMLGNVDTQEFYDLRMDLYRLGLLLYKMLLLSSEADPRGKEDSESSSVPFEMEKGNKNLPHRVEGMVSEGQIKSVDGTEMMLPALHLLNPAVSRVLSGLVKLAICHDPLQRFQSARTFFLALARAFAIEERRLSQPELIQAEETTVSPDLKEILVRPVTERRISLPLAQRLQLRKQFIQLYRDQYVQRPWQLSQIFSPSDQSFQHQRHRHSSLTRRGARWRRVWGVVCDLPKKVIVPHTLQNIKKTIYLYFIIFLLLVLILSLLLYIHNRTASNKKPAYVITTILLREGHT